MDECLMRGKRKANKGGLLAGDNVPPHRPETTTAVWWTAAHGFSYWSGWSRASYRRDAATLGPIIAANVKSRTTIVSDEWPAYNCVPALVDSNGVNMNLVHLTLDHSVNFVNPGAHTKHRECLAESEAPSDKKRPKTHPETHRLVPSVDLVGVDQRPIALRRPLHTPHMEAIARH